MSRFGPFTDAELHTLWEEVTRDDGSRLGVASDDQPLFGLLRELFREAQRRGLELPDEWVAANPELRGPQAEQ